MNSLKRDREIVRKLPRTWPAFFEVHGRLLDIQRKAIPVILEGKNVLLSSPTASGKTEAVCAPLVERNIDINSPWTILYICPTRALVNDLYERLYTPLSSLDLRLLRKTGDHSGGRYGIPHVLITTPESFDSIMCRGRNNRYIHTLARVKAVVLDEIHLLYGTQRGEQVRWLIERLKRLKIYASRLRRSYSNEIQIVGLSATISEPEKIIHDFMWEGEHILSEGKREITVLNDYMEPVHRALLKYIKEHLINSEKILVFCNRRKRVDILASHVRKELDKYDYKVVAHHGSLSKRVREDAEEAIKKNDRIVAFATSTLELGIDIGDIDLIVLDGPAPDLAALLQRLGRGNRRTGQIRVITCADSMSDALIHEAMMEAVKNDYMTSHHTGSNYSVLFQQIASYIFQSPTRSRKRSTVEDFLISNLSAETAKSIIDSMIDEEDLIEDEEGLRLGDYWQDMTEYGKIHSNIDFSFGYNVIDEYTGEKIATGVRCVQGKGLKTGGELLQIRNFKDYNIEVKKVKDEMLARGEWSYASERIFKNSSQAGAIRKYLGIDDNIWPVVKKSHLVYIFHLGGAVRQTIIEGLARMSRPENRPVRSNQFYFALSQVSNKKPEWINDIQSASFELYMNREISWFEGKLCRPKLNSKLPCNIRCEEVKEWLNFESEILSIKESLWEEHIDKTVREVCLILSETKD
jgi:ATP-dependent Lhr-like helicase